MRAKSKISAYILRASAAALLVSCVIVALASAIGLTNHSPKVPKPKENAAVGMNEHESTASAAASTIRRDRTLTFADRVAYQRAIEEVYWRHRIWPAANAGPKPPLDRVMSHEAIEKKVEDYLRDSQALEDYWQRPITPDQLEAEMQRIASHTKQPAVLRELFATLGNDPFVIAECLARPVLAERLITELYAHDQRFHGELKRRAEAELRIHGSVREMKQTSGTYTEMEWIKSEDAEPVVAGVPPAQPTRLPPQKSADDKSAKGVEMNSSEWQESVQKLAAEFGNQDIVGQAPLLPNGRLVAGAAALQPGRARSPGAPMREGTDVLAQIKTGVLSPLQEDEAHYFAVAVIKKGKDRLKLATIAWLKEPLGSWLAKAETQAPMTMAAVSANYGLPVISGPSGNPKPSGGCTDDTWTPTSTTNAPAARVEHTAVWTGSEMIVWGGFNGSNDLNTGGRYNPSTDSWTTTSLTNAPSARSLHTAVWTGTKMIIWGGSPYTNTGGRYDPSTNSWTTTSSTNAPSARSLHTAVWTGSEMIIWGGQYGFNFLNTGGRYNPTTNSWIATSTTNAPDGRASHTAVWTGSEMVVWGGNTFNTGGRYNPSTDSWTATNVTNAPAARSGHTAVWTTREMIVWGGNNVSGYLNTGGRYNPTTDTWSASSLTNAPTARSSHTAVWTGSEMIIWGGWNGSVLFNSGGRYSPSADSWTATSLTDAPAARSGHTAVWTGNQMIVWGGGNFLNTGGRYCAVSPGPTPTPTITSTPTATATASPTPTPCADDTWTPTSLTSAPAARAYHTAVWTGTEMIVWGGNSFAIYVNTGGRYNPSTDSWTPTSTASAPDPRDGHTAVWTGSEMVVWGGADASNYFNTGGRYNPSTNSWTATRTTNAPTGRYGPATVWTGSEMIVWGGYDGTNVLNTGGRYNPNTDSWTATSTNNAPTDRYEHTAVWTGSEMIVWGGYSAGFLNTGGRYNPSTDSWTATTLTNAPSARADHTAVWTGSEMIVWGGDSGDNTGGSYNLSTDTWIPTSVVNAPDPRAHHTAVWTGNEMIVWGGNSGDNTGGRYYRATDSWTATSTANAPDARAFHTAVWTGSQMIVWGGQAPSDMYLNSGGKYCATTSHPRVALYDQYNNAGTYATVSATFTDSPPHNSDLADDFVVPGGQSWSVQSIDAEGAYFNGSGPAYSFNVFFYTNSGGFPGTQVYGVSQQPFTQTGTMFTVNLPTPAMLSAGTYWVEIQANMNFSAYGEWGWADRTVTSNNAAVWQNPGGGFGVCPSWSRRGASCNIDPSEPDQVFRLSGTIGAPLPTPTATHTPTPTPTATPTPTSTPTTTPTATSTPTPTPSPTASPTPTPTPTPCTGRCSPTPRPCPTSAGRPTPRPRLTPPPTASPSVTPAPRPTAPPRLTPPPTPTGSPRPTPAPRP